MPLNTSTSFLVLARILIAFQLLDFATGFLRWRYWGGHGTMVRIF